MFRECCCGDVAVTWCPQKTFWILVTWCVSWNSAKLAYLENWWFWYEILDFRRCGDPKSVIRIRKWSIMQNPKCFFEKPYNFVAETLDRPLLTSLGIPGGCSGRIPYFENFRVFMIFHRYARYWKSRIFGDVVTPNPWFWYENRRWCKIRSDFSNKHLKNVPGTLLWWRCGDLVSQKNILDIGDVMCILKFS